MDPERARALLAEERQRIEEVGVGRELTALLEPASSATLIFFFRFLFSFFSTLSLSFSFFFSFFFFTGRRRTTPASTNTTTRLWWMNHGIHRGPAGQRLHRRAARLAAGHLSPGPRSMRPTARSLRRSSAPTSPLRPAGQFCALLAAKDHVNVFLYDGAIVPDPEGIITAGHDNNTARTVAIRRGEASTHPPSPPCPAHHREQPAAGGQGEREADPREPGCERSGAHAASGEQRWAASGQWEARG